MRQILVFILPVVFVLSSCSREQKEGSLPSYGMDNPQERAEWEHLISQDPATGLIPVTRDQELEFVRNIPALPRTSARSGDYDWEALGPFNFGGRTRGAAFDIRDESILIAGSASGGIYKSENGGAKWARVSAPDQAWGITCLVQDTRSEKEDIWYAGSGESYNSPSLQGSRYIGNGILKSTDNGESWQALESTQTGTPQILDEWDRIWRVITDPVSTDDVVFAAITGNIMRSDDGGETWTSVLGGGNNYYSDIAVTSDGVFYATLSGDGAVEGIHRSTNGVNWTDITPTNWPSAFQRTVIGITPGDEDELYFMAQGTTNGKTMYNFRGTAERVSLWKYSYLNGDGSGSGGFWEDVSQNLPRGPYPFDDVNLQGGYNMLVSISPDDPNLVIIGGTNLFRSTTGFTDSTHTTFIGGYGETTALPDFQIYENHHPDQHLFFFSNDDPDVAYSCNDGGVFRTDDVHATPVVWESLNNEYNTTQFYTVAIDHDPNGTGDIMGGLQDNGTFLNVNGDANDWKFPWSYDGAYTAIGDNGSSYLTSIQLGRMFKLEIDGNGNRTGWKRFDPIGSYNYYFIHPWAMDPNDNGIVYLPNQGRLWRNDIVDELVIDNGTDSISEGWVNWNTNVSGNGTSVGISTNNPPNRVYVGTSTGNMARFDDANTSTPTILNVSANLASSGWLNCIAVDEEDADHVVAIFSNYNAHSIMFTEDGGDTWYRGGGNLEADSAPAGAPADLYHISNAPSVRWARIIHVDTGTVYLVGTTVGLYATNKLAKGTDRVSDSTMWYKVAEEEIGATVVSMIDHRDEDGFVVVATHGSGIFTTIIDNNWQFTGLQKTSAETRVNLYPNPSNGLFTLATDDVIRQVRIYSVSGRLVHMEQANKSNIKVRLALESGIYLAEIETDSGTTTKRFFIR